MSAQPKQPLSKQKVLEDKVDFFQKIDPIAEETCRRLNILAKMETPKRDHYVRESRLLETCRGMLAEVIFKADLEDGSEADRVEKMLIHHAKKVERLKGMADITAAEMGIDFDDPKLNELLS